jgi:hypothetical protein
MKKKLFLLSYLLFVFVPIIKAQIPINQRITPHGIFDNVSDRFGNKYPLINTSLNSANPFTEMAFIQSPPPTNFCSAGYFDLYFAPGSMFAQSTAAASVICEIFRNISGFINSPLSALSNTVRINIYCDNTNLAGVSGLASSLYNYVYNPANPNQGIIQNQIQKAIISGIDPFASYLSISGS